MASKTGICNQALLHLKNSKTLTNVDTDNSIQANTLLLFYDDALEEVLREFDWPFAKRIAALALVEEDPDDGVEWAYSYRWPSGCLRARYIVSGTTAVGTTTPKVAFEIGADDTGLLILTNEVDAVLAYTKSIDDVSVMSPRFRTAFSYLLAYKVAPTLCGEDRGGLGNKALAFYALELSRAKEEYLNERQHGLSRESEFIEGR